MNLFSRGRGIVGALTSKSDVTTVSLAVSGESEFVGTVGIANAITDVADGAAMVATAAGITGGILTSTPSVARTLTTDTAVAILALLKGAVGQTYDLTLINIGAGGIITLAGGVGVTIVGSTTTAANASSRWHVRVASATTVVIYRG